MDLSKSIWGLGREKKDLCSLYRVQRCYKDPGNRLYGAQQI